ncbi:hypothetical protein [Xenorhabdus sp. IM139775]|uniref:hypothetical protein n=1 Tax=Xenorhabdus sp. IM139775 TaxID=3025876 RepID=UPI00235A3BEC|nr:hypothetical protein [Xenorhabdus sp. IM139775]MDC9592403.1 hypothetical protein [Xenorhabdus sp. IM139775]
MKKYKILISIIIALNFSACSNGMKMTEATHSLKPNHVAHKTEYSGLIDMKECGRGYVVGVWSNADSWNEWAVWLSETGRSWGNNNAKIYWAYSKLKTDYDSGKNAYATILAAQANGQMVSLFDEQLGFRCNSWGYGSYRGAQFDSVQAWYP